MTSEVGHVTLYCNNVYCMYIYIYKYTESERERERARERARERESTLLWEREYIAMGERVHCYLM